MCKAAALVIRALECGRTIWDMGPDVNQQLRGFSGCFAVQPAAELHIRASGLDPKATEKRELSWITQKGFARSESWQLQQAQRHGSKPKLFMKHRPARGDG